jgi:uncharacterized protein (TIGR00369 family)
MKKNAKAKVARNFCFGCGQDNSQGMRLKFSVDPAESVVRGAFRLAGRYQGPSASAHGGIIATVMDDAMGKLNRVEGIRAVTAELNVEYLRPVPLGRKIVVQARRAEQRGRNYFRECTIHDSDGNLLARGRTRYVKIGEREKAVTSDTSDK